MMQGNGWTITKSYVGGKGREAKPKHVVPFKLYDDDGNLYFDGVMSEKLVPPFVDLYTSYVASEGPDTKISPSVLIVTAGGPSVAVYAVPL